MTYLWETGVQKNHKVSAFGEILRKNAKNGSYLTLLLPMFSSWQESLRPTSTIPVLSTFIKLLRESKKGKKVRDLRKTNKFNTIHVIPSRYPRLTGLRKHFW